MKVKLLRKLRRISYLERRNSEYRAVVDSTLLKCGRTSCWVKDIKKAKDYLRNAILDFARSNYKHAKIKL